MRSSQRRRWAVTGTTVVWCAAAAVLAVSSGADAPLPAVALGSAALLYVERFTVLVLAFVLLAMVLDRALRGELPVEVRGLKYADRDATQELADLTQAALAELDGRVEDLGYVVGEIRGATTRDDATTAHGSLDVTVVDATGSVEEEATVPADVSAGRILAKLIDLLELPVAGPDGMPLSYAFHHMSTGRQLDDSETFSEAGVADGDVLRVVAEITAGAGPSVAMRQARQPRTEPESASWLSHREHHSSISQVLDRMSMLRF